MVVVDAFLVVIDEAAAIAFAAVELDGGSASFAVVAGVVAFAEFVEFENCVFDVFVFASKYDGEFSFLFFEVDEGFEK